MVVSGADSEIKTTSQNSNTGAATFREKKNISPFFSSLLQKVD